MFKKVLIFAVIFSLTPLPFLSRVYAAEFSPGFIISDIELRDSTSMDLIDIQSFLNSRPGALKRMHFKDVDGVSRSAAEIIYRSAITYKINPKYLLVTLQKEQSLLDDPAPSQKQLDWATGYAVCDSCSMDDPDIQKFKGFANQVDYAAGANDYYFANANQFNFKPGGTYNIDGETVNIFNQATANLYIYTPHIHGNYNFWKLWNRYFSQKYPDGSLLQVDGEPGVWLIEYGQKRPFYSKGALISRYDINNVILVDKNALNAYPTGNPIKYAQYSLLKTPDGKIYLLADDKLRHIINMDVFRTIGFNIEEVISMDAGEVSLFKPGEPITLNTAYPAGALLQDNETGGVYFAQNGVKKPVVNKYILEINFPQYNITQVSPEELEKFPRGELVQLKDGILIKSFDSPDVYVTSNGKKIRITSEKSFNSMGYKWTNIHIIDPVTLLNTPSGGDLSIDYLEN